MHSIKVNLGERSYEIIVGKNILHKAGQFLKKLNFDRDIVIITNQAIREKHIGKLSKSLVNCGYRIKVEEIPDSEKSKSYRQYYRLITHLYQFEGDKRYLGLIAFGGGVVGDLTGFIASTYKRGIPYIQVPTTLLAQVDSSIGGKTGIDAPFAKNLFGTIYQPKLVINDLTLLKTLPAREIKSGLSEVVKYGIIANSSLFNFIENNIKQIMRLNLSVLEYIVTECCKIKADIVSQDEYDDVTGKRIRVRLNFGHTIAHAIEAATKYGVYTHGEAVAIGMVAEADIAVKVGLLKEEVKERIEQLLIRLNLPTSFHTCSINSVLTHISYDKKFRYGKNRFALPKSIGEVIIKDDIEEELIKEVLNERMERMKSEVKRSNFSSTV